MTREPGFYWVEFIGWEIAQWTEEGWKTLGFEGYNTDKLFTSIGPRVTPSAAPISEEEIEAKILEVKRKGLNPSNEAYELALWAIERMKQ